MCPEYKATDIELAKVRNLSHVAILFGMMKVGAPHLLAPQATTSQHTQCTETFKLAKENRLLRFWDGVGTHVNPREVVVKLKMHLIIWI